VKAVVHDRYGPPEVLRLEDVDPPVPADDELLVRVHATTVNRTDCGFRSAEFFPSRFFTGLLRPKQRVLGMEFAGEVEAVGASVREFAVGDRVFGVRGAGAHAELVRVRETAAVAHMPAGLDYEEAAPLSDGACIALSCLRNVGLWNGKSVLVYGASGSVGTAAVQLLQHFGAHVTAVCNGKNVELVRSLGADVVIDYEREDFTKSGQTYDVVFDAVGKHSFRRARHAVRPGGHFVDTDPGYLWHVPALALVTRWVGSKKVTLGIAKYTKEDVLLVRELAEAGAFRAVVDRTYRLEQIVEAAKYVETGQKTGNVVLRVGVG
jgi:NADPH:quinone reductase-like Zn-dependent oxidoreductase